MLDRFNRVMFYRTVSCFGVIIICTFNLYLYTVVNKSESLTIKFFGGTVISRNSTVLRSESLFVRNSYLIDSPNCKIPSLNPFDESISKFVKKINREECSSRPPLTEVVFSPSTGKHELQIRLSAFPHYTKDINARCCVSSIQGWVDNNIIGQCFYFEDSLVLDERHQFVAVFCFEDDEKKLIYKNTHAAAVRKKKVKPKEDPMKLNVLLIGLDSMSRLNLYRTMPQTVSHLRRHGWIEVKGYNKVGDNTLPNLMALLTGLPVDQFEFPHRNFYDYYPFIWKNFSSKGYVTAYAEDSAGISTFNNYKKGFMFPPTDHYLRCFFSVTESTFGEEIKCPGYSSSDRLFDYLLDYVEVYKADRFFGLFWENQFSHNDLNLPSAEDSTVLKLLKRLENLGTTNTTMVVFLSDHGMRVGQMRETIQGWYEDRMPFLFITLPQWYKSRNDLQILNLLKNAEGLTSPYDLHMTLSQVLYGEDPKPPPGCETCHSLLSPIPLNRTCAQAGISDHWCTCCDILEYTGPESLYMANLVISAINNKLRNDPDMEEGFTCEPISLRNVLYFREKVTTKNRQYVVGISAFPEGAVFEGTVGINESSYKVEPLAVSRVSFWVGDTSCAKNPVTKEFCVCRSLSSSLI